MSEPLGWILPTVIGLAIRCAVTLHPHSGQTQPPLYGDYEAQRHWMEITVNLPSSDWYVNTSSNDLNYWGLDYPPLTAYHSWAMGQLSQYINPKWTQLFDSRGTESSDHKVFMRYTVLFTDFLIFMPAVLIFFYISLPKVVRNFEITPFYGSCLALLYPALILIDHGHFQYNSVSLGLFLQSINLFIHNSDLLGSVVFCLTLGYKQMELYHAMPIFFYLLGKCATTSFVNAVLYFSRLSICVIGTFCFVLTPFLFNLKQLLHIFERMFPVNRGLFEDKVSNFWCVSTPLIKWRHYLTQTQLLFLSTGIVLATVLPICVKLLIHPTKRLLLQALVIVSLCFFLFSYQVHEKSILLVAIPVLCLLPLEPRPCFYFLLVSTLSVWPLMLKDDLALACMCTLTLYYVVGTVVIERDLPQHKNKWVTWENLRSTSLLVYIILIFVSAVVPAPAAYPDIYPLLISAFSCGHFLCFLSYWYYQSFTNVKTW